MSAKSENDRNAHDIAQLRQARSLMILAFVAGILSFAPVLGDSFKMLGHTSHLIAFLAGAAGIYWVTLVFGSGWLIQIVGVFSTPIQGFNLLTLAYFIYHVSDPIKYREDYAVDGGDADNTPSRPIIDPGHPVARAIAHVKIAGLSFPTPFQRLDVKATSSGISLPESDVPVFLSFKTAFGVAFFIEEGDGFKYVTAGDVRSAGISDIQLLQIGLDNLNELTVKGTLKRMPHSTGMVMDGQFEASMVLLDDLWNRALKKDFPTAPVVAIPARDICAYCDAASPEGIAELKSLVARVSQGGDHLLSQSLFTRTADGQWLAFKG